MNCVASPVKACNTEFIESTYAKDKKMTAKQIDSVVNAMFHRIASGIQFDIMVLGKISNSAKSVLVAGGTEADAEVAMQAAIAKYRES